LIAGRVSPITIWKNIRELVTAAPRFAEAGNPLGILTDAALVLIHDTIAWVGQTKELPAEYTRQPDIRVIDLGGQVVIPGLIDAHTHLIFAGAREKEFFERLAGVPYMEIAKRGGGILATVRATRAASLDQLIELGRRRLDQALMLGVTTMEAKSGYGLTTPDEIKILEAIAHLEQTHPMTLVPTFMGAHEVPPEFRPGNKAGYIDCLVNEMIPEVARRKLARFCDVFCEEGVFDVRETERILAAGLAAGLTPRLHADEFVPIGGTELAVKMGAASVDHLHVITESGLAALAGSRTVPILLPGTGFYLSLKQHAPARRLLDLGLPVALASDFNPGSCMTQSLPLVMTIACIQMKMTVAEVMLAVTRHAARALGLEHDIGSLEPGKKGDFVSLNIPSLEYFLYHFGVSHVSRVVKRGNLVFEQNAKVNWPEFEPEAAHV
jgi:imidazolonepropionase